MIDLSGFGSALLAGTLVTIQLALAAMTVAIVLGLLGAVARESRTPLRWVAVGYTTVVRGLPELLVILLVYFGSVGVLNSIAGAMGHQGYVELSPFLAGVIALSFNYGAYMTEIFRGALNTIPPGQIEAGQAVGLSRRVIFRRIVLPQLWRVALPATGNIFLALMKDTALVSVIGAPDLMRQTRIAVSATREPFDFYFTAALIYLLLTAVATLGIHWLERRTSHGMKTLKS